MHNAVTCSHMEQRRRCHKRCRHICWSLSRACHISCGYGFLFGKCCCSRHCGNVQDVVHRSTVSELCTFGKPSCSRGIKNCRVIIGINLHCGQHTRICQCHHFAPRHRPIRSTITTHSNHLERSSVGGLGKSLKAFIVCNEHCRLTVVEGVLHFARRPPCIHTHSSSTEGHCCPIRNNPFGVVTHRDCYTCARAHTHTVKVGRQFAHLGMYIGIGITLVFIDQVVLLSVAS